jgi:hypothetical protein
MWNQIWFLNQFDFIFIFCKIQNKKFKNVKNQVLISVRWAFDFSYRLRFQVFEKFRIIKPSVSGISKTSKELPGFMKEPTKTQQF